MTDACRLPTPAERRYGEIQGRIEQALLQKIHAALDEAATQARAGIGAADLDMAPPAADYFTALVHQNLFCTLCKADPKTFAGGRVDIALAILRNGQNIARHYWGADIPRP